MCLELSPEEPMAPVNYLDDGWELYQTLMSCDAVTQMGESWFCVRDGQMAVFVWTGDTKALLAEAAAILA